jgi:murein DD-endopeptidase MepM/ murein hydrolase activator NlpD
MDLKIYWPIKPYVVTQDWGVVTDAYSNQFNDPNFKRHNGIDANVGRSGDIAYQTQFPIYCPVEGFRVESVSFEANGGGNQVSLVSIDPVQVGDRTCYARVWLCHGKKVLVKENYRPKLGELLMIGNNTGFSTGPHTHLGLYRIDGSGYKLDSNDATGSTDPALFFEHEYAIDQAGVPLLIANGLRLARYYLTGK